MELRINRGTSPITHNVQIKSFQIPRSVFEDIKNSAVPESMARQYPNSPILVDPTKAANQFGLPSNQINFLQNEILKGTGKIEK